MENLEMNHDCDLISSGTRRLAWDRLVQRGVHMEVLLRVTLKGRS
jgi:hypothetical protein